MSVNLSTDDEEKTSLTLEHTYFLTSLAMLFVYNGTS